MGRLPGTRHNKLARHSLFSRISAKILAQRAIKRQLLAIVSTQDELFRARTHIRPSRATNFAHSTQKHGDVETNNTTARPQQGTTETAITFAPENCTKTAHFSPAKAIAVSNPHRHKQAKATRVSNHRATWPTGPGCSTRGRRRGLAGLRADTPSEARGADGSRAGRRPRAHQAARPTCTHNDTRPQPVSRSRPRHAHAAALSTAPPAIRRSCPRDPQPRRGQPRGGRRGRGTGSRTRSPGPRRGRSGSTAGRHRARHTRRA